MWLSELIVVNYRSVKKLRVTFNPDQPKVFIGLNDCGKSTILHALDLLLGDKPKYNSKSDGSNKCDLSNTTLPIGELVELLAELKLPNIEYTGVETFLVGKLCFSDEELKSFESKTLSSTLMWTLENANDNIIWIIKVFKNSNSSMYLKVKDSEDHLEVWNAKATDLKSTIKENNVSDDDIKNENGKGRYSNFEQLRAVYNKRNLIDCWIEYKYAKSDKEIFPIFKYYDWNCSFEDINSLANTIMHEHIQIHLKPIKESAIIAAKEAEQIVNVEFSKLSEEIRKVAKGVTNIKSKIHFDVSESISDIMVNKDYADEDIHLELQGEGLKRQIWFSLIKAKAERTEVKIYKQFIWAFDEPETHLYPGAQRELFDIVKKLSTGNVQTIISTHSTIFIDRSKISDIYRVELNQSYSEVSNCSDIDDIHNSLSVRNSDFLFYDKFLIVEGDTEQFLIPKLYELYFQRTLVGDNIQMINIKGKDNWLFSKGIIDKMMSGFKKNEQNIVYLFDNDMRYEIGQNAITNNMFFVGIQDIEDAIENKIWAEIIFERSNEIVFYNEDQVFELKNRIPTERKGDKHEKFYKLLQKEIKAKFVEVSIDDHSYDILPSKGSELAEMLLNHITSKNQVPEKIQHAFDKLQ